QVAASMAEFMANMNRGAGGDEAGGAGGCHLQFVTTGYRHVSENDTMDAFYRE
ncbi:hypothetical protein Tco_0984243, partial [Tanacetum coccineum]